MALLHSLVLAALLMLCQIGMVGTSASSGVPDIGTSKQALSFIELDPSVDRIPLWRGLHVVADPEGSLSPETVETQIQSGKFGALPRPNFAYGKWFSYPYWVQFKVKNPGQQAEQWFMTYEFPVQDEVQLWVKNDAGTWEPYLQLDERRSHTLGSGDLYPVWRVQLQPRQAKDFMIRIHGNNMIRFPLYVQRDDVFVQQQRILHFGIGILLAIPLVVVLYTLTLIGAADDKSLPLFLAMAGLELIGATWVSGIMHEVLPWIDRGLSGWIGWAAYTAALGLSCQHARIFVSTQANDRLADAILLACAWLWLAVNPFYAWLFPEAARATLLFDGVAHAFVLTWLAWRGYSRQRSLHMGLFVAAWMVYAISGILYMLYRMAELPIYVTQMSRFAEGAFVAAILGCAVSVRVMARRREMQKQLELEKDRSALYAAAHHDLWQPIQSIGLYVQSFEQADEPQRKKLLKGMNAAMTAISDFMAGWQQLSGKQSPTPKIVAVDLDDLLAPIVEEYRHLCQTKHIMLRYRPLKMQVRTDVQYLQRIVRNLLSNAMRYTESGGRILVGGRRRDGQRWLVVADTGIGMNEEQAAQCFDAFKRFGDIEKVPEGMGIGLYSVKKMAQALGVRTSLVSWPGKGTVVSVSLGRLHEAGSKKYDVSPLTVVSKGGVRARKCPSQAVGSNAATRKFVDQILIPQRDK